MGFAPCLIWQSFCAVCPSWRNPEEICVSSWKQTRDLSLAQLIWKVWWLLSRRPRIYFPYLASLVFTSQDEESHGGEYESGVSKISDKCFHQKKQQCQEHMSSHEYGRSIGSEGQSGCNIRNTKRLSNKYRLKATQLPKPEQHLALARHIEAGHIQRYIKATCVSYKITSMTAAGRSCMLSFRFIYVCLKKRKKE